MIMDNEEGVFLKTLSSYRTEQQPIWVIAWSTNFW